MTDLRWCSLSRGVKVLCISDQNGGANLLIDISGRFVFNRDDASDRGSESFLWRTVKRYDASFFLALFSRLGDADIID